MLESFASSLTFLQVCCQSALLSCFGSAGAPEHRIGDDDFWEHRSRYLAACDFLFCPGPAAEVIGRIGAQIGQGCFGTVYALYRWKLSVGMLRAVHAVCGGPLKPS